jgi:hypothetical protein
MIAGFSETLLPMGQTSRCHATGDINLAAHNPLLDRPMGYVKQKNGIILRVAEVFTFLGCYAA